MEYTVHDLSWIRISASGKPFLLRALARNMLILKNIELFIQLELINIQNRSHMRLRYKMIVHVSLFV